MSFDYSRSLDSDEVLVCLVDGQGYYPDLSESIEAAGRAYGFSFVAGEERFARLTGNYSIRHAIVVDGCDAPDEVTRKYRVLLDACTSATLAISYTSRPSFDRAGPIVDRLKRIHRHVNYLRPTPFGQGYRPAREKLVDNSICDSVRIKYRPVRTGVHVDLPTSYLRFFKRMSAEIRARQLYHRASTDGFISIRSPEGGFFVTATKTDKIELDTSRISLVHSYERSSNEVHFAGRFLPSSDSVEAATLYARLPWLGALVHTHASSQFTRNPEYTHRVAVPPARYGEPDLGDRVADFVESCAMNDFVIMDDHGEMFFAGHSDPDRCGDEILAVLSSELDVESSASVAS